MQKEEEIIKGAKSLKRLEAMASRTKIGGVPSESIRSFKEGGGRVGAGAGGLVGFKFGGWSSPIPLLPFPQ